MSMKPVAAITHLWFKQLFEKPWAVLIISRPQSLHCEIYSLASLGDGEESNNNNKNQDLCTVRYAQWNQLSLGEEEKEISTSL